MTRDELVNVLRFHRAEIVEADEWRPLVDHVLSIIQQRTEQPIAPESKQRTIGRTHYILHKLWSAAVDKDGYDKHLWMDLAEGINELSQ